MMKELFIKTEFPYSIYIGDNILLNHFFYDYCKSLNKKTVIVTNSHLIHSHAQTIKDIFHQHGDFVEIISFSAGEHNKTRETKQQLEDILLEKKYGRDTCL